MLELELDRNEAGGKKTAGINVRSGTITDMLDEKVLQPLLVIYRQDA